MAPRNYRRFNRKRRSRKPSTALIKTIRHESKLATMKEAETKRCFFTNLNHNFTTDDASTFYHDVISSIPQSGGALQASWTNRRIGNSVQPCWLKGYIYIRNLHHGTFDYEKNYSIRVMFLKDKNNVVNDPSVPAGSMPLYRHEGETVTASGALYDNLRDIDYRSWKVMSDKQYKLFQYSTFSAGSNTPFLKIPVSINLTKCNFAFDRGESQLSKENIIMLVQSRSFNGNLVSNQSVSISYELVLSFKDF